MGLRADIRPFKKWGQNFITDPALLDKLVRTVQPQPDDIMVEVGPGTGALTRLFVPRVKQFHAIEIDERMDESLAPIGSEYNSFSYEYMDFQKWTPPVDFKSFRVIGNIPYYITSPLILQVFKHLDVMHDVHFLMQKEVGKRLVAPHGSKQYGILSVYSALFARTEYLFDISRTVFHPVPDVDSCFVRFSFNPDNRFSADFESQLREVIRTSFNQRRKTLRNSLKHVLKRLGLDDITFDMGLRPEQLEPKEFIQLTREIFGT